VGQLAPLLELDVAGLPIDVPTALRAGEIRASFYSRDGMALSLADCILLASAEPDDEVATADAAVIAVARKLDVAVIPLLDSGGHRAG
jgi:predicted nucleic acid-binding protein